MSDSSSQQSGLPPAGAASPTSNRLEGAEGTVKWFDPRKGFGFIVGPDGKDVFAHFSVIQGDGFRVLKDGASVHYDALKTERGWKATKVTRDEAIGVTEAAKKGYSRTPRR